jgi:hypothetical protein
MIKVVWLLIVVHYSPAEDAVRWSETHGFETAELCASAAVEGILYLKSQGIKREYVMSGCIQRIVPDKKDAAK